MSLSVVIPTYDNTEFLDELFESIEKNNFIQNCEILIGIDNCIRTLEYVLKKQFPQNFKFFYFTQNYGPYVIKNTLVQISNFDKIFFFDSDDIMEYNTLEEIISKLDHFECVKPKYINFEERESERFFLEQKPTFGEGVFGIRKEKFLSLNGFEGWRVAADSDFMGRLYKTNVKLLHTNDVLFFRRLHPKSLTINPETNYSSQIRTRYYYLSKQKTIKDIVLPEYKIGDFQEVSSARLFDINTNTGEITDEVLEDIKNKEQKAKLLSGLFETLPKKMVNNSLPKTINYQQINNTVDLKKTSNVSQALKKVKLENIKKSFKR